MISDSESSLVASCLKGKRSAQHTLYHRYCDAMYNVCYRLMGNEGEAEDALQESFVFIFKNLESFRGESSLGGWIKRIVINHCLNQLKKRRIVFEEMKESYDSYTYEEDEIDYEHIQYEVNRIRKAIMKLPDGYRQVLTLYLIEGYDHNEIAAILGIQETGSKSQYSRARVKLRELLNEHVKS